jgi:glutathione S-transferase
MRELILHHYDFSNFSEKIRLILGFKDLAWRSVEIPSHLPKPDYTPLTLGYRRTPALQIGADVYCDTGLIAEELERRFPQPSIYSPGNGLGNGLGNGSGDRPGLSDENTSAQARASSQCLASWAEGPLLWPAALYVTGVNAENFPDSFHFDRAKLHNKPTPTVAQVKRAGLSYFTEMKVQMARIESLLATQRTFILGQSATLADFIVYGSPWLLETLGGRSEVLDKLPNTRQWMSRVAAIGHGSATPMSAEEAMTIANLAAPESLGESLSDAHGEQNTMPDGISKGDEVKVSPRDENSPAFGTLVALNDNEIVIRGSNDRVNSVQVHFPRVGYRLSKIK